MEELLGLKFQDPHVFLLLQDKFPSRRGSSLRGPAREYIGDTKGRKVFDLYSGTGTIAQIPGPGRQTDIVTGVEIVEESS